MTLVVLCTAACFPTGFNLVALGYVAPQFAGLLGVTPDALAPAFIAGGIGNVIGSLILGPLADRVGRKAVIAGALACSIPCVFGTALAGSVGALAASQFAANFLLMGSLPEVLTVAGGEYVPAIVKTRAVAVAWLGFMAGMIVAGGVVVVLAGLAGAAARGIFIAATVAAVLATIVALRLPAAPPIVRASRRGGFPIRALFTDGRARLTLVLWAMFVANLTAVFFLTAWLTTLLHAEGLPERTAVGLSAVLNVGSAIGGLTIATLVERRRNGRFALLAAPLLVGGGCIAAVGLVGPVVPLIAVAVAAAGLFANGSQNAATAMVATLYPLEMRSTGASWAIGIGQCGQIAGSLLGGMLLAKHWPVGHIFVVMATGSAIAAACAPLVERRAS